MMKILCKPSKQLAGSILLTDMIACTSCGFQYVDLRNRMVPTGDGDNRERDKKNCDVLVLSLVFSKIQLCGRACTSKVLDREARHIAGR